MHRVTHAHPFFHYLTKEQAVLAIAAGAVLSVSVAPDLIRKLSPDLIRFLYFILRRKEAGIRIGKIFLSDSSRLRHTHIAGATGTGKTVLIEKMVREDLRRGGGAIIVDPKGDRSFYEAVKQYCKEIGREGDLHLLSTTHPRESVTWNPCSLGNASELQTKFYNSSVYSEPHYAKACEFGLLTAFRDLRSSADPFTLQNLLVKLKSLSSTHKDDTLSGLFFDLSNLIYGEWEQVFTRSENDTRTELNLLNLIQKNQILFVDLPTEGKRVQSSRIGRLLTQEIILISGMRKRNPELMGNRPFSVYIDEFDAFATESFSSFLNKGRSSDFMIHLAHQTLSDLNVISPEFSGQIMGNCNNRFIFRQDDPDDAERWARFIGTKKVIKKTYKTEGGYQTGDASNRESQEFIISPDTIKTLPIGECVFNSKTTNESRILKVPFIKTKKPRRKPNSPLPTSERDLEVPRSEEMRPALGLTPVDPKEDHLDSRPHPNPRGTP